MTTTKRARLSVRRTALVVEVPEVDDAVANIRRELDPMAGKGVPPHMTVLFPFVTADQVDADLVTRLEALFRRAPSFEQSFLDVRWFGDEVLWLASDGDEHLRSLTGLVTTQFPDYSPYGGVHAEVIPHLTVADHAPIDAMRAAEASLRLRLPIRATTTHVSLLVEQSSGHWTREGSFTLGPEASQ